MKTATTTKNEWSAWSAWTLLAHARRLKGRQLGFALYEPGRRPGIPPRTANAHARFEYAARQALRDWLMI